jgi:hypothetical protein
VCRSEGLPARMHPKESTLARLQVLKEDPERASATRHMVDLSSRVDRAELQRWLDAEEASKQTAAPVVSEVSSGEAELIRALTADSRLK